MRLFHIAHTYSATWSTLLISIINHHVALNLDLPWFLLFELLLKLLTCIWHMDAKTFYFKKVDIESVKQTDQLVLIKWN